MARTTNIFAFVISMARRRGLKETMLKNAEILFGYPLYWLSFLFPRDRNSWVVGSENGFVGNAKFFLLDGRTLASGKHICWICASKDEVAKVRRVYPRAYWRWSPKGLFHSLRAGVYVFTHHLPDINFWTSGGARAVNLWHGVGIKNIEFRTSVGNAGRIYREKNLLARIYLPHLFRRPDLMLSTSPMMTGHFAGCFRIPEQACVEDMYPRCRPFFWSAGKLKDFIYACEEAPVVELYEKMQHYERVYLYMPTWREDRSDFIKSSGIDFARLNRVLERKRALFLLKLHPATCLKVDLEACPNIAVVDKDVDIYSLLPATDVLVTDYSSIYYDYVLMKEKRILLFPFDYSDYVAQDRDLAFDFDTYTPGPRVHTFEELLDYVEDESRFVADDRREWVIGQFWGRTAENPDRNALIDRIDSLP